MGQDNDNLNLDLDIDMLTEGNSGDIIIESKEDLLKVNLDGNQPSKDKEIDSEGKDSLESVAGDNNKNLGDPGAKPSPKPSDTSPGIYSSLATHLHESGVLPSLDLEKHKITNVSELQEAIKREIDDARDINQQEYYKAMSEGQPKDAYVEYTRTRAQLDAITPEVLDSPESAQLRYNIIAQDFLNRNFSREDAVKHAQRSQDLGEDVEDAVKALESVKEYNKTRYQESVDIKKAEETKAVDDINKFINNTKEIIKGVELTQATKDNLLKQMTTAVGRDSKGNPVTEYGSSLLKDPVRTKAITEYLFLVTKGFKDFSKMTDIISSKASSDFDKVLRSSSADFLSQGTPGNFIDDNQSFSINDEFTLDI